MTYLLAFLAGMFGLGMLRWLSRPRHHHPYDENREFYDADTNCGGGDGCDNDCGE
jgi:hypothetical protein